MRADCSNDEQSSPVINQKGIIPGFPHWSEKIPSGTEQEDIIKNYPNHLRGDLLLQIATFWSPKEISKTSRAPNLLRPNTITKRITQARIKNATTDRKSTARSKIKAKAKQLVSDKPSTPNQEPVEQKFIESEASMKFRLEQQDLLSIMGELDPSWTLRQTNRNRKRINWDRELTERAAVERERRLGSVLELGAEGGEVSVS